MTQRSRLGLVSLALLALQFVPATALGATSGSCTISGTSAGTTVDLATTDSWHVRAADSFVVTTTAPFEIQRLVGPEGAADDGITHHWLAALGVTTVLGSVDDPPGTISGAGLQAQAALGPRFDAGAGVYGPADEDSCSWFVTIVLDDVNPLFTLLGGGGLLAAVVGLIAVALGLRRRGLPARVMVGVLGGAGGVGAWSALEQFGLVPWNLHGPGAILGLAGLILGLVLTGRRARPTTPA